MDFQEYQQKSYVAIQPHESNKEEIMHWAIGMGEEAGEALSVIKHKYYGGKYNSEDLVGELGDLLWYISALCTASGIDLQDVAEYNLAKLQFRYPSNKFDNKRSIDRHNLYEVFKCTDKTRKCIVDKIHKDEKTN